MNDLKKLQELYAKNSKHSNYQILSRRLTSLIDPGNFEIKSRFELERLNYFMKNIDISGKKILDVGGNTGFFSFEMLDLGADFVHYFEGNKTHADFVKLAAKVLKLDRKIEIFYKYFTSEDDLPSKIYDITLLLNVLHHIGDDYGSNEISIEQAKFNIIQQLNLLANKTKMLIFQLGFNWKGNRELGLFKNGTKKEVIEFVKSGIADRWDIIKIGIAEKVGNQIVYKDINDKNIERDNSLGEFLNRPIFILKSKAIYNS